MKKKKSVSLLEAFWKEKTLEQLISDQKVRPIENLEDVWGKSSELWTDDEDFEAFLEATKGGEVERS